MTQNIVDSHHGASLFNLSSLDKQVCDFVSHRPIVLQDTEMVQ